MLTTIHSGSTTAAPVLFEMTVQHTVGLKKKKKRCHLKPQEKSWIGLTKT